MKFDRSMLPGDIVEWDSQAGGTWLRKRGMLIGFIAKNESLHEKFPKEGKRLLDVSNTMNRALVSVFMTGYSNGMLDKKVILKTCKDKYYAPNERALRRVA